ncbi:MAG TPA: hypothetical protein VJM50_16225 [Pyrinomonadaceae bacterium]|nr:hypothetical protein [Pyrinomonadaceae bacterium]
MNRGILLGTSLLLIVPALVWLAIDAVEARSSETITQSVRVARCFQDTELSKSLATLKLQGGPELVKVHESLLSKARTAPGCRTQLVQALISNMAQATDPAGNQYENFYFWQSGASLLADLKATEALDLLIANIDFTDGWSASLSKYHFPALAAILEIGLPAIPKLQIALRNDPVPHRRKFAALCIVYIGGAQARRALTSALPGETDPCTKKFLQLSVQAFDNRTKPNHISSALRGKWGSAFYCL